MRGEEVSPPVDSLLSGWFTEPVERGFVNRMILVLPVLLLLVLGGCGAGIESADLVLHSGKIVTLDDELGEVEALAIRGDRIVAAGSDSQIRKFIGEGTKVIDLNGGLATPGFIEGHGHFLAMGQSQMILRLGEASTWGEIVQMVEQAASKTPPGEWIRGRGWHQSKWSVPPNPTLEGLPFHESLSAVSPHHPVLLIHASGHASFVNAKAMELAGITNQTPDPEGGEIVRDDQGRAIGMLRETAQRRVRRVPGSDVEGRPLQPTRESLLRQVSLTAQECLSKGITTFQDAGSTFATVDLLSDLAEAGELPLRLWVMLAEDNEALKNEISSYRQINSAGHRLTVRAIKRSIDGALGTHGAWLLEPYSDMPSSSGLNTTPLDVLRETARIAIENDFQLCVHAIGDRGNFETLNVFEQTFREHPEAKDLRWRIEHAQHLQPSDIPRFADLGVIASMQGVHSTSDGAWVPDRLGEKRTREGAYVWRSLMEAGAVVTNGTDAPVEDVSPILSFYASVSRKLRDGSVFLPGQRMTRLEALRSYTTHNAFAGFEEDLKGTLSPGKLADVTVLDRDILTIPEDEIPKTRVVYTIVGGKVEFSNL